LAAIRKARKMFIAGRDLAPEISIHPPSTIEISAASRLTPLQGPASPGCG
jgi:hypothetical protein